MLNLLCFALRTGLFAEGHFFGKVLDEWLYDTQEFIRTKLPHLVFVAIVAIVLTRILRAVTAHMVRLAERRASNTLRVGQVRTLAGVVRATGITIIAVIVAMQVLEAVGVAVAPLLGTASIVGVATGLAAQNIIKDVLNGAMILIEDQFNVGDTVTLAGLTGVVETMTLRKTTVRGGDGTLYVIPNSQITTVANQSVDFSVATINISVDFSADPNEVLEILRSTARDVRNSDQFKNDFLADPQILGVDSMKGSQLIFPVVFRTKATKQYGPMREFQRQVRLALQEHHVLPGDPNRVFNAFLADGGASHSTAPMSTPRHEPSVRSDPTTLKPQESNPFTGE